ncbi:MAG TPA: iron-sulfur cluster repair di-iron protein [Actinomycetales bacterium]|nr:iron-sulfur cluster repair di-iron protein [Actinomycetales bacterium]
MTVDASSTLSDLVTQDPRRARVLEKFELDYCCHGQRPLDEAATERGLDVDEVAAALDLGETASGTAPQQTAENAALAHDIVDTHHAYMWQEMPRLQALVDKVARVHGERHPELARVQVAFSEAVTALDPHMTTEERVVFPAISRLEKAQLPPFGSFVEPIAQLRAEHDAVGDLFKEIRSLTSGYVAPEDGCNSYRAMLAGLEEMELDLHEHIHKENNILFPRTLQLEQRIGAGQAAAVR